MILINSQAQPVKNINVKT